MRIYLGGTEVRTDSFIAAVLLLVFPSGMALADNSPATVDFLVADGAKKAVRAKLRDPNSAVFVVRVSRKSGHPMACGTVNAKNGFGGMSGPERFLSNGATITVLESEMQKGGMNELYAKFC